LKFQFTFLRREDHPIAYWVWNAAALLCAALLTGALSLWFSTGSYWIPMFLSYFQHPLLAALNLLPPVLLAFLLWFVTGRSWIAFLSTSSLVMILSWANYCKILARDDPLVFEDLMLIQEGVKMSDQYEVLIHGSMWASIGLIAAVTVFLFFCAKGKPIGKIRLIGSVAALACTAAPGYLYYSDEVYDTATENGAMVSQWSENQTFISKGFLYPFLHSITDILLTPPTGYSELTTETRLSNYEDVDIPDDEKVNIIGIQLEAFSDFSKYDQLEFSFDVYEAFHELEDESYSGNLLTNIFAGGTVYTERTFLTGYSSLGNFRSNTNSYVWYFKNQGYQTTGDHPCYEWMYNRMNINQYLGFDSYRFVENYYGELTNDQVANDDTFFSELADRCLSLMDSDEPLFSFNVSYQGHGPYDDYICWWGEKGDYVVNQGYTDEQQYILDNYFGSVHDTSENLAEFVDTFRESDEPVVIVVFGDHNPWLGYSTSVYQALGINLDCGTTEGFYNYYGTRYLIWANDAAKEALGYDFVGEGPDLGPYFLMSELFELCGWEGSAYMQSISQVKEAVPVLGENGIYLEDGTLTDTLSEEDEELVSEYLQNQYYTQYHFND